MPAGFQCFNDFGSFQVDGEFKNFVLSRVLTLTTNLSLASDNQTSAVQTSIAAMEICAIRGLIACSVLGVSNGVITLSSMGGIGTQVTVYFFTPITSSTATSGLQVFNSVGELVFCATKKPLRIVDFLQGNVSKTYDNSRVYAAMMLTQSYMTRSAIMGVGGSVFFNEAAIRGMVTVIPAGIKISDENEYIFTRNVSSNAPTPNVRPQVTSINKNFHAVIDVTDY